MGINNKPTVAPSNFVYFILFFAYFLLDAMFPFKRFEASAGRIYPQVAMGLIFAYSLFYVIVNLNHITKRKIFKPFICLLILMLFYVPFTNDMSVFENIIQYMKMNTASVTFLGIYLALRKKPDSIKWVYFIFALELISGLYMLFIDYYETIILSLNNNIDGIFDSNSGFVLASLIPMSLMLPSKRIRIIAYAIIVVSCLFCGQRAAALAAIISVPFAMKFLVGSIKKSEYFGLFVLGVLVIVILYPYIESSVQNLMLRQELEASKGDLGSGRSTFWKYIIDSYLNGNPINMIVGYGFFSVNSLLNLKYGYAIAAHNGFLEYLYSFGLIGFSIYLSIYFRLLGYYKSLKRNKSIYASMILMMFLVFSLRSITSHGDLNISYIPFFLPIAILMARPQKATN